MDSISKLLSSKFVSIVMAFKLLPTVVLLCMILSHNVADADVCIEDTCKPREGCCPEYWIRLGNRCYRYFGQGQNWHDARHTCAEFGGDLPSIHNWVENEALYQLWLGFAGVPDSGNAYLIGLHDTYVEGHFQWSDGSPYNYQNWSPNQPDDSNGEDCVHIFYRGTNSNEKQQWNDLPCDFILPFFCAKGLE